MNSTQIENHAISYLKLCLGKCPLLSPCISDNDKTPTWDGNIIAYSEPGKQGEFSKEFYHGSIPVQVKGTTTIKDLSVDEVSWSANKADLLNFQRNGGAIYFVIALDSTGDQHRIFYASLLPYDLIQLLSGKESNKDISVHLCAFPEGDTAEITSIAFDFIRDSQKQSTLRYRDAIPTIVGADALQAIDHFSVTFSSVDPTDWLHDISILSRANYIYAHTKGFDTTFPLHKITSDCKMEASVNIEKAIYVNGRKYYDSFAFGFCAGAPFARLGQGIEIQLTQSENEEGKLTMTLQGALSERIRDMEFFLNLIQHGTIYADEHILLSYEPRIPTEVLDEQQKMFQYLKLIQQTFSVLGVDGDLDFSDWDDEQEKNIRALIHSVLYNHHVSMNCDSEGIAHGIMTFSNISVMLIAVIQEDKQWLIRDYFQSGMDVVHIRYDDVPPQEFLAPLYVLLKKQQLAMMSNLNCDVILSAFESIKDPAPHLFGFANMLLLEILHAVDMGGLNTERLLGLAFSLNKWIIGHEQNPTTLYSAINQLQIVSRQRCLTIDEICQLTELYHKAKEANVKCAACILLGEHESAKKHFIEMDAESKESFMGFPIYNFLNGTAHVPTLAVMPPAAH